MKITRSKLKQIIKEELSNVLEEVPLEEAGMMTNTELDDIVAEIKELLARVHGTEVAKQLPPAVQKGLDLLKLAVGEPDPPDVDAMMARADPTLARDVARPGRDYEYVD
jgi:uncharacterized protein YecA (UPF0149 family)